MAIAQDKLEGILKENFPKAQIKVVALVDDGDHYSVEIVDEIFAGKTRVQQHKIVNEALKEILGGALHAMQLKTGSV